jgi:drug/metabolite transporter (DMT)-like permease
LALASGEIDPGSFTMVRLVSGAATLMLILMFRNMRRRDTTHTQTGSLSVQVNGSQGSWLGASTLFAYALGFSYAYIELDTGTGALILFGSVQLSMIAYGLFKGERFNIWQWFGLATAFIGLLYLLWPNISTPSFVGALLMVAAGLAWGMYSIIGRGSQDALADTAFNFLRSGAFVVGLFIGLTVVTNEQLELSFYTFMLALLSGALASGMGYAIWYSVLPKLSAMNAAVAQLSVPIIAALGGLLLVNEPITLRLAIASVLVLGGVYIVMKLKTKHR